MDERRAEVLRSVLRTLLAEAEQLRHLISLAHQEQEALLRSDYAAIDATGQAMAARSMSIEELERERLSLLEGTGAEKATLDALERLARDAGLAGFAEARARLLPAAQELRDLQEQNARLLLSAMKLNERWIRMFGSLSSPTYGSDGSQERQPGRRLMSRSA